MANDKEDLKPMPVGPKESGAPIPLGGKNLASILGSAERPNPRALDNLQGSIAAAPAYNHQFNRAMHVKSEAEARAVMAGIVPRQSVHSVEQHRGSKPVQTVFRRGDVAYDTVKQKKVTIIQACVDRTSKGTAIHSVCDKRGNQWRVKEKHLQPIE